MHRDFLLLRTSWVGRSFFLTRFCMCFRIIRTHNLPDWKTKTREFIRESPQLALSFWLLLIPRSHAASFTVEDFLIEKKICHLTMMPRATHFNKTISSPQQDGFILLKQQEDGISSLESRLSSLKLRTDSVMVATSIATSTSRRLSPKRQKMVRALWVSNEPVSLFWWAHWLTKKEALLSPHSGL
jgi:hypothetical protein